MLPRPERSEQAKQLHELPEFIIKGIEFKNYINDNEFSKSISKQFVKIREIWQKLF